MFEEFWQSEHPASLGRLSVAFLLTLPIALDRERADRIMGLRTFPLVATSHRQSNCGNSPARKSRRICAAASAVSRRPSWSSPTIQPSSIGAQSPSGVTVSSFAIDPNHATPRYPPRALLANKKGPREALADHTRTISWLCLAFGLPARFFEESPIRKVACCFPGCAPYTWALRLASNVCTSRSASSLSRP